MNGINKVTIEAVSIKDGKDGKYGMSWGYGIRVDGEWHNGFLKSQSQVDGMLAKKGQEVELFFFQHEKYGNQVRFVTDKDRKEQPKNTHGTHDESAPSANIDASINYQAPEVAIAEVLKRIEALEEWRRGLRGIATKDPDYVNRDDIPEEPKQDDNSLPF